VAPQDRGPSPDDNRRMDEIRARQQRPAGDPRVTGERGVPGRPYHVVIDDAADKFFDSFRAPTAAEGPQRPGEGSEDRTGESLFRATLHDQQAVAQAAKEATGELRASVDMLGRWTADMGRYTALYRQEQDAERVRVDTVLTRIEAHYARLAEAAEGGSGGRPGRRRGGEPPAGPTRRSGDPIPDLDDPSFPPVPGPTPGGPPACPRCGLPMQPRIGGGRFCPNCGHGSGGPGGGGGSGGGGGGGRPPRPPAGPAQGPERPPPHNQGYAELDTHLRRARTDSRGGIRRDIRVNAAEQLHQSLGMGLRRGNTIIPARDENGEVTHFEERDGDGNLVRMAEPGTEEGTRMARTAIRMASISRAAGSLAAGRGLGGVAAGALRGAAGAAAGGGAAAAAGGAGAAVGGLASLGAKAIPVVGWGLAAADLIGSGFRVAQDQRAKNAVYQSVYGGSNTEGFGQRLQEEGFAWSEYFNTGFDDENSRKLFKGVSRMGFKDSQRSDMLQFASEQYKRRGMSADESLAAIEIAASGANTSLTGLDKALDRVTDAARRTGQSAEVLRGKFLQTFSAATAAGYGVQAANVAGIVTAEGPGLSRNLQNVNYSGMFTEQQERLTAASMGMSYGSYVAQNAQGNIAPGMEAKDQRIKQMISAVTTPQQRAEIDRMVEEAGGIEAVKKNPGAMRRIGLRLHEMDLDPGIVKQLAEGMVGPGTLADVEPDAVGEWVVQQHIGAGDLSEAADAEQAAENQRKLAPGEVDLGSPWLGPLAEVPGSQYVQDNWTDSIFDSGGRQRNEPLTAYGARQGSTGMSDPAIEAMIDATGQYSEAGVEVQTKDGPRVVTQAEAIQYYPDQIASGEATYVGGPSDIAGRKIGEVTGVTQKDVTTAGGRDENTTDDAAPEKAKGVSAEEWRAEHESSYDDAAGANAGGKITLDLSDEARRLFDVRTEGNVSDPQVEAGARAGVPPR
jgi:hypothetical protein